MSDVQVVYVTLTIIDDIHEVTLLVKREKELEFTR